MEDKDSHIQAILDRNERVEKDKQWETSLTRRGFITLVTYSAAFGFFWINGFQNPELQACIPSGAYILSTLSLPPLKKMWMKKRS